MTVLNVFRVLSRYGSSQSENYLTESFVQVLRVLKARDRPALVEIVRELSDLDSIDGTPQNAPISIRTQTALVKGDQISARVGHSLQIFVELKNGRRWQRGSSAATMTRSAMNSGMLGVLCY